MHAESVRSLKQTNTAARRTKYTVSFTRSNRALSASCTCITRTVQYHTAAPLHLFNNRADLAAAELEALRDEHEADPLPDGWFFDGAVFVDHDGNRKRERPGKQC